MNNDQIAMLISMARLRQDAVMTAKAADYAEGVGGEYEADRLANFKLVADLLVGAPLDTTTVAAVYWLKHVISIAKAVRERNVASEPLPGRFDDEANYNILLQANLIETNPVLMGFPPDDEGLPATVRVVPIRPGVHPVVMQTEDGLREMTAEEALATLVGGGEEAFGEVRPVD